MSTDIELKTVEKERDKELSPTSKRKKEKESGKDKPASPPTEKKSKKTKEEASVAETPKRPISELYDMNGRELSDVVRELCARYPEINWLTSKTNETPEGLILKSDKRISEQLYGETHIEFDKTIVSIFCLFWLCGDQHKKFIECQAPPIALKKESFDELKRYVEGICDTPDKIEALVVFTVLNDLGKVESVVQLVRSKTAVEEVDHDKILWMGLKTNPNMFKSYQALSEDNKQALLKGLGAQFNFAQLVQAENLPGNLIGLRGLDPKSVDLFNLHALFDMAGAAGHVKHNGSLVLAEATYHDVMMTIEAVKTVASGATPTQVYDTYLHERGKSLGLDVHRPTQKCLIRICCLLRYHSKEQAQKVVEASELLSRETFATLRREMCTAGIDDGWGILLYYAPALLLNLQATFGAKPTDPPHVGAIQIGMETLVKCYNRAREWIKDRKGSGVFTADIADIATIAKNPEQLHKISYVLNPIGEDGKIVGKIEEDAPFSK